MASGLRVFLVTCVTLCIFPAIHGEFNPQDGTNIRQNNDPANVGGDRYPVKRDVGAGGGQRPLRGAAAMPAQRGFGPQQPQQQFQPNPKLAIAPNPNNPGGQGLGMLKQPGMPGDDIARGNFGQGARFDQVQRQPGQPGQLPGQQRAWVGRGDVAPKPYPAPGQGRPDTGRPSNRPMRINDSPQCREDVAHFCGKNARGNNFSVLDCLQNAGEKSTQAGGKDVGELSDTCNRFLWSYKMNLTKDVRFDSAAFEVCKPELKRFPDCDRIERGQGLLLPCLYDVAENITTIQCRQYINRMKAITFSDYRLIQGFYDQCRSDIESKNCGNVKNIQQDAPHRQGATINCLEKGVEKLQPECKKQILRVAELSANDYHTDRALYFACRDDRERFCEGEAAGQGAIYNCLLKHKFKEDMSENCRNKLTTRQKVASVDAKANYRLFRKCKNDIKKTKCNRPKDSQNREFRLSKLLICLEEAKHNNIKLSGDCVAELEETRKSLMEDYMINPEIITMCKDEIGNHCSGLERGGKTLHCLMKLTQEKPPKLGQDCEKALQDLVKTADAGANYRIDNALHKACKPVRDKLCKDVEAGDANCKTVLTKRSIQRKEDFRLNPRMQKACRRDMPKFCSDVLDKSKKEEYKEKELEGEMLLCLKKKFPTKSLSPDCENYIRDAIQEASMDIRMDPVLFSGCQDTAKRLCSEELETPGQGLVAECLKTNLYKGKIISLKCRMQVIRLLQECRTDVHIDTLLYKACALDIKHFCAGIPQGEGRQMSCLLEALEDSTVKLHADCQRMLSERKEMWRYAIRESPPNSFPDLAAAINAPKARGQLLTILFLIIGVLGFGGLYCYSSRQKIQH